MRLQVSYRWYVPVDGTHEDTLWSVEVRDDMVWSNKPTDHSLVLLSLERAKGERGHHRRTVREELILKPSVQDKIRKTTEEAYARGGREHA